MTIRTIDTQEAPGAVGAYSQGKVLDGIIFTSGQIGIDPVRGEMVEEGFQAEVRQALDNLRAVVRAGGGGVTTVVKTTVFLVDLDHYGTVNEVYRGIFEEALPARSVVEVADLPAGARIEVEAVAAVK